MTTIHPVACDPAVAPAAPVGPRRLLAAPTTDLAGHARRYGGLPDLAEPARLIAVVADSGLTGRGGAGFPTWRKLAAVAAGPRPVVIGNGAEGEPASAKDKTLLTRHPHLVLDGLQLAAVAVGAVRAYLYLPEEHAGPVRSALLARGAAGWDRVAVEVVHAPRAFVAGEESAVVNAVSGGPGLPQDTPRRVVEVGLRGAPTLVQNVETLAHLALVARFGAEWFRGQGTPAEPGTFLATISGAVVSPGVYEAPYGIPLGELFRLAGGLTEPGQAVLVGGYHGGWVRPDPQLPVSRAGLSTGGLTPGAGVLSVLPQHVCGLAASARIVNYLARESAGQCGPCLNGLPRLAQALGRLADIRQRPDPATLAEVERLAGLSGGRGACHHPDGTIRFVRSSLRTFAAEVDRHRVGDCVGRREAADVAH